MIPVPYWIASPQVESYHGEVSIDQWIKDSFQELANAFLSPYRDIHLASK